MSSGSSGRYQSRIFNFVHQQSRRLTEQLEHTIRYVQVATKWGVELILYPIYLLLQPDQSSERTLSSKEPPTRLQLEAETPPPSDTPIQNVLETVKNLPFTETTTTPSNSISTVKKPLVFLESLWLQFLPTSPSNNSTLSQSLTILENPVGSLNPLPEYQMVQGIATDVENRNLLLITTNNETLDILTPQEQAKLEELIISEVANYWRAWRLLETKKQANLLPEIERLLTKLTGGKPEEIPALSPGDIIEEVVVPEALPTAPKALAFLDKVVANWESNIVVPMQQRSQEIIQVAQTQFNIFLYGKEQLAARGQLTVPADSLENQTPNIPALITAAINYFFGIGSDKKLGNKELRNQLPGKKSPHLPTKFLKNNLVVNEVSTPDPWLTWDDLFGESETAVVQPAKPSAETNPALPANPSAIPAIPKNLVKSYQNFLQQPQKDAGLVQQKKTKRNLTSTQKKSSKVTASKRTSASISQPKTQTSRVSQKGEISQRQQINQVEAQPDWIETKATLIGYEKHILEQILEWLDTIMLWLEEIALNLISFLKGLLRIK
ncbi:hypothetical protein NIES37_18390 [Tolypothrix tenuis PCC 7101]|uniref:Uncharacterized protein n=1 Tax=Tolypothrix tenuis PCC 7101 TaxID=231146 RepID=A0A1Z4MWT2_9CYAN|nr:hypothetical protein [Aulosira sp. FACHB-113]BAY97891.1 hypothetical protein NIES37_18390 [Tolypothrix tenuis PCC 7101]BAZ71602.1 hypothetical protein NIES50_01450 [Aulosira laxa NIES-50]